jgi:predicted glycoside hydrolase/deacetylase ChbG (UPF0249 family)
MPLQVVINADDLGLCQGVNSAIARAHRDGVLTSASLMANGSAFDHAVESVIQQNPGLGIGIHFCLTSGRCVSAPGEIPSLVDSRGRFRHGFVGLLRQLRSRPRDLLQQIENELLAQFERVRMAGVSIDHVDGHRHVQMIPSIYSLVSRIASAHGCGWIRRSRESLAPLQCWISTAAFNRLRNLPKQQLLACLDRRNHGQGQLSSTSRYRGLLDSGSMSAPTLRRILQGPPGTSLEVNTHPAVAGTHADATWSDSDRAFVASSQRARELDALIDRGVRRHIESSGHQLCRFADLTSSATGERPRRKPGRPVSTDSSNASEAKLLIATKP